jgi:hypothetical protein
MPDYKRTKQIFKAGGIAHIYKKPLEQVDDELFHTKLPPQILGPDIIAISPNHLMLECIFMYHFDYYGDI